MSCHLASSTMVKILLWEGMQIRIVSGGLPRWDSRGPHRKCSEKGKGYWLGASTFRGLSCRLPSTLVSPGASGQGHYYVLLGRYSTAGPAAH